MTTRVWMIEHWDDDEREYRSPDPEDGIFLDEDKARAAVDAINKVAREAWLKRYDGYMDSPWDFRQKTARWAAENIDKPEAEREPRPERRKRTIEDYPERLDSRIIEFEVTE